MVTRLTNIYRNHFQLVLAAAIAALSCLAFFNRFIQDDAFISFRYAQNLVDGYGLVFNIGERVEGYTNFLWTMLIAGGLYLGIDPVVFSMALGLMFFAISLVFTYKTSFLLLRSKGAALLTIIFLGTNYTFSAYATGGLETQLQACLFVLTIYLLLRSLHTQDWSFRTLMLLSLLLSAALLTMLDSAVLAVVVCPIVLLSVLRLDTKPAAKLWRLLAFGLPALVLVGGWLLWKLSFYGSIIPNSFYAKQYPFLAAAMISGAFYLVSFALTYLLVLVAPMCVLAIRRRGRRLTLGSLIILALILLWSLYIMLVGGDFMEFRFLVPVLPFLFVSLTWLSTRFVRGRTAQMALITLILAGSLAHALTFGFFGNAGRIETVAELEGHVSPEGENWEGLGKALGRQFSFSPDVTIAMAPVGVVPYYSRLKTVDVLGLNDPWVAQNGESIGFKSGHMRMAPIAYLSRRGVNLVIGQIPAKSTVFGSSTTYSKEDVRRFAWMQEDDRLPAGSKVVEIPVGSGYAFPALYLTASPTVDEVISRYGWKVYQITEAPSQAGKLPFEVPNQEP